MPTLPPERTHTEVSAPHQARSIAESFGSDPARYDRTRPHYPEAMVERITASAPGPDVLDVGCGTGICARQFQTAGARVLGVEVDPRMAAFARGPELPVEVAPFETWDAQGRTFDAVIAGQTWHWIDPIAGATKAARVLRPGGRLALFWNVGQPPAALAEAFTATYQRVLPELPRLPPEKPALDTYAPMAAKAIDGIRETRAFDEPERWRYDHKRAYTRDTWLDQLPTHGGHSQLSPGQLEEFLVGVGAAIDAVGGGFTMRYATMVVTTARIL